MSKEGQAAPRTGFFHFFERQEVPITHSYVFIIIHLDLYTYIPTYICKLWGLGRTLY